MPARNNNTKTYEQNGSTEPTERSNSPQIINIPTPKATIPRSGVSFPRALMFLGSTKRRWGVKKIKTSIKPIKTTRVPAARDEKNFDIFPSIFNTATTVWQFSFILSVFYNSLQASLKENIRKHGNNALFPLLLDSCTPKKPTFQEHWEEDPTFP
jgi:hypothetical protein